MKCLVILSLMAYVEAGYYYYQGTNSKTKGYIEYLPGSRGSQIIISAPHGGYLNPSNIPNRRYGCLKDGKCIWKHNCGQTSTKCKSVWVNDDNTKEISRILRNEIYRLTNKWPHLIINMLRREKMDANRDKDQAAFGNPDAESAWEDYHSYIEYAKRSIHGPGVLFDIHGKRRERIELGYLLNGPTLDNGPIHPNETSIYSLYKRFKGRKDFNEILRGQNSFGGILQGYGYETIPSPDLPGPKGARFYRGGYITRRHGSLNGGNTDAIQIESPKSLRLDNVYPAYSKDLAEAIVRFVHKYYENHDYRFYHSYGCW